ncbi:TPA: hypothetical protein ACSZCW_06805 [Listeria monocytogenes]|uniref:hypothetical protein n=1 Tax=Listeria monocytogenes TaxID=1639 RepID=UPI00159FE107|nr:hypothetical protein [Listeria monocytogenes]EAF7007493.1 hypothetical protein [Listeria monocytogenes]MBN4102298.1 hypothetical protein [Listeria monocytogenes]NVW49315.1 hypothetical protein [Listeria monocytogenes]HAA6089492.1 hypothetical protein [Listeria monocytogenes]
MPRPRKVKLAKMQFLHGAWTLDEFADASTRSVSWWQKNIYKYPEVANFSNWNDKSYHEQWAFDAVKANEWILNHFVYKKV